MIKKQKNKQKNITAYLKANFGLKNKITKGESISTKSLKKECLVYISLANQL